jgi:hypothetical protein
MPVNHPLTIPWSPRTSHPAEGHHGHARQGRNRHPGGAWHHASPPGAPAWPRRELDAAEADEVHILANNFPVAKGAVIVSGNRIAVEVKELTPRLADLR